MQFGDFDIITCSMYEDQDRRHETDFQLSWIGWIFSDLVYSYVYCGNAQKMRSLS